MNQPPVEADKLGQVPASTDAALLLAVTRARAAATGQDVRDVPTDKLGAVLMLDVLARIGIGHAAAPDPLNTAYAQACRDELHQRALDTNPGRTS